jgi:hypothetical protein
LYLRFFEVFSFFTEMHMSNLTKSFFKSLFTEIDVALIGFGFFCCSLTSLYAFVRIALALY